MKRRKFILGAGSLAAGGAAAMGTGAFSQAEITRDFEVDLSSDTTAQVRLQPGNINGEYAELAGGGGSPDDTLAVELNGQAPGAGNGVNANAVFTFEDLFRIRNFSPEPKGFYITFSKPSGGAYSAGSNVDPSDITFQFLDSSGSTIVGSGNAHAVSPGGNLKVTLVVDTTDVPGNADISEAGQALREITVNGVDNP